MNDKPYFEQIEKNIKALLVEEKFEAAYSMLNDYIEKYPNEKKLQKLKKKIEEEVEKKNKAIVTARIDVVEKMVKDNEYDKALKELGALLELAPDNRSLKNRYQSIQDKYKKQVERNSKEFEKAQRQRLRGLLDTNPEELLNELYRLEANNPKNSKVFNLINEFKTELIKRKINEKQALIRSEKYEDIRNFIVQLENIDAKNSQIAILKKQIAQKVQGDEKESEGEFLYKSAENLETLMKLKKFDKAIILATQILKITPKNNKVRSTLKKAEKNLRAESEKKTISLIHEDLPNLKKEFSKNKKKFVKI